MRLHSSWRGIVGGLIGGGVLVGFGLWAVTVTGAAPVPVIVLGVGVFVIAVMAADFPLSAEITRDGVTRRTMVRSQHLPWARVRMLSRGRPSVRVRSRSLAPGPLVAVVGRRRYLLVDQVESRAEYDELIDLLRSIDRRIDAEELLPPPEGTAPTWLYRRSGNGRAPRR
jgi:hypothetical protein